MKFFLSALAAAALWVVDAQNLRNVKNVKTLAFYQNLAEAFATGVPDVDKGSTFIAVLGVYSDSGFQNKIGESVTTCILTGEPTLYDNPPIPPIILNSQSMCHGELAIWEPTAAQGTFILEGIVNELDFGKDTAIVGGTGVYAGAQGVVTGAGFASVAKYVVPNNL